MSTGHRLDESLSVDAPLPYNTSTLLSDLVKLLLKVLLAEEYAAGSSPSPLARDYCKGVS